MNVVQVKFPIKPYARESVSLNNLLQKSQQQPKRKNTIAELCQRRKLLQDQMTNQLQSINSERPKGRFSPAFLKRKNLNAIRRREPPTNYLDQSPRNSNNTLSIRDDIRHFSEKKYSEPGRKENNVIKWAAQTTNSQKHHKFRETERESLESLSSWDKLNYHQSPTTSQKLMGKTCFIDDDLTAAYQDNVLKSILSIKRNREYEQSEQHIELHQSKKSDFTYMRVLKLPYHWNDNYYQQKLGSRRDGYINEGTTQSKPDEDEKRLPTPPQKTAVVKYKDKPKKEILKQLVKPPTRQLSKCSDLRPRLFYGDLNIVINRKNNVDMGIELTKGFENETPLPGKDTEDYFHYYVQKLKE